MTRLVGHLAWVVVRGMGAVDEDERAAIAQQIEGQASEGRVEDLLTHRSGWQGDRFFVQAQRVRTLAGLVDEFAENEQLTEPGSVWSYDNAAFSVAGRLLEVVAGEPYPAALRRLVLEPLGLSHSFLRADEAITHRVAAPHIVGPNGPRVLRGAGWQPGWV